MPQTYLLICFKGCSICYHTSLTEIQGHNSIFSSLLAAEEEVFSWGLRNWEANVLLEGGRRKRDIGSHAVKCKRQNQMPLVAARAPLLEHREADLLNDFYFLQSHGGWRHSQLKCTQRKSLMPAASHHTSCSTSLIASIFTLDTFMDFSSSSIMSVSKAYLPS